MNLDPQNYPPQSWPNQIELRDLKRIEDNIPYLCGADEHVRTNGVLPQMNGQVILDANGLNRGTHKCKTSTRLGWQDFLATGQTNQWYDAGNYSQGNNHNFSVNPDLPSQIQRSSHQCQGTSLQSSYTVHHRVQNKVVQNDEVLNRVNQNNCQIVAGMCILALLPLKTDRCH